MENNARQVIQQAVLAANIVRKPMVLYADNGNPIKPATLLEKLRDMNIDFSFRRPLVSNSNAYAEALFRACKYVPSYTVKSLESLDKAREWVHGFFRWCNHEHSHSAIRFITSAECHCGEESSFKTLGCEPSSTRHKSAPSEKFQNGLISKYWEML